jgi:hypothetical protein
MHKNSWYDKNLATNQRAELYPWHAAYIEFEGDWYA